VFEDTYNIIEIEDGRINVDIKTVGGKRAALSDIVKTYDQNAKPTDAR
jgi:hypothetical protein